MTGMALRRNDLDWFSAATAPRGETGFSDREVRRAGQISVSSAALDQLGATWLYPAVEKIFELTRLEPGWDSYKGVSVDRSLAVYAVEVLASLGTDLLPVGSVHPLSGGGVQVEWHRGGKHLEMTFYRPYETEVSYSEDGGHEEALSVQEDVTPLRKLLAHMLE
jgi:hypothetical protein